MSENTSVETGVSRPIRVCQKMLLLQEKLATPKAVCQKTQILKDEVGAKKKGLPENTAAYNVLSSLHW